MRQEEIMHMFPQSMRGKWKKVAQMADRLQEIRLRVNAPAAVLIDGREWFVDEHGSLLDRPPDGGGSEPEELEEIPYMHLRMRYGRDLSQYKAVIAWVWRDRSSWKRKTGYAI